MPDWTKEVTIGGVFDAEVFDSVVFDMALTSTPESPATGSWVVQSPASGSWTPEV